MMDWSERKGAQDNGEGAGMNVTRAIRQQAQRIIIITPEQAKQLPGLLGTLVPTMLRHHGWYACHVDKIKTLYQVPS